MCGNQAPPCRLCIEWHSRVGKFPVYKSNFRNKTSTMYHPKTRIAFGNSAEKVIVKEKQRCNNINNDKKNRIQIDDNKRRSKSMCVSAALSFSLGHTDRIVIASVHCALLSHTFHILRFPSHYSLGVVRICLPCSVSPTCVYLWHCLNVLDVLRK